MEKSSSVRRASIFIGTTNSGERSDTLSLYIHENVLAKLLTIWGYPGVTLLGRRLRANTELNFCATGFEWSLVLR